MLRTTSTPSLLQKAHAESDKDLTLLLERYEENYDLAEIETLILRSDVSTAIKHAAYLYLLAHGSLNQIKSLAPEFDFTYQDSNGHTAVLAAIYNKDHEVLKWLVEEKKQDLTATNISGAGVVLIAIKQGRLELLRELLKPVSQQGYGCGLNETYCDGTGPLAMAIRNGQIDIFRELVTLLREEDTIVSLKYKEQLIEENTPALLAIQGGQLEMLKMLLKPVSEGGIVGDSLKMRNSIGAGPVLTAIQYGQPELLKELVKPIAEGGFGCSLDEENYLREGPVSVAIVYGQLAMLDKLVKPIALGGYGLNLLEQSKNNDPIQLAINFNQLEVIKIFSKPVSQGGYGLINLEEIDKLLMPSIHHQDIFLFLFMEAFNQRLETSKHSEALAWVQTKQRNFYFMQSLTPLLRKRYEALLKCYTKSPDDRSSDIQLVVECLDALSPADGAMRLAAIDAKQGDFISAYKNYLSVLHIYNSASIDLREIAKFELANLILTGHVILKDGELDEEQSKLQALLSEDELKTQGKTINILQQRAIYAYEYVYTNSIPEASLMRQQLNSILSNQLSLTSEKTHPWTLSSIAQFYDYYLKRNTHLLQCKQLNTSLQYHAKQDQALVSSSKASLFPRPSETKSSTTKQHQRRHSFSS